MNKETTDLTTIFGNIEAVAERPKTLAHGFAGTEDIATNEIRLPRLAIAQGLSPQITPGDPQYIDGLKLFDMFHDLDGTIYGRGPITIVPVQRAVQRIEFIPRSEGGGIVDLEVPANDERLLWRVVDGERRPPVATTFVEFVVLMLRPNCAPEPIVLSIKGTNKWNRRASDQFTTFIKLRNAPIYSGMYKIDTLTPAKNDKGTFGVPVIKNAGFIPVDTPAGNTLFVFAKNFHESLLGKNIIVKREMDENTDFDTEAMDNESTKVAL